MPACEATRPHRDRQVRSRVDSSLLYAQLGSDQSGKYIDDLRDTMKGLVRGTVITRARDDIRPGVLMATGGRHSIFFEADDSRILVVRVLHDRMDYCRHLSAPDGDEGA